MIRRIIKLAEPQPTAIGGTFAIFFSLLLDFFEIVACICLEINLSIQIVAICSAVNSENETRVLKGQYLIQRREEQIMFGYLGTGNRVKCESANLTSKSGDLTGPLQRLLPRKLHFMGVLGFLALMLIGSIDNAAANAQVTMGRGTAS